MALTPIQQVRLSVADNEPGLYIITDDEIEYIINKNYGNINRASVEAAKIILLHLAKNSSTEVVDIFSIKGKDVAEQYRLALELFIKDPNLNPLINNLKGWVGGVSNTEMQQNDCNLDNHIVVKPTEDRFPIRTGPFTVGWRF